MKSIDIGLFWIHITDNSSKERKLDINYNGIANLQVSRPFWIYRY